MKIVGLLFLCILFSAPALAQDKRAAAVPGCQGDAANKGLVKGSNDYADSVGACLGAKAPHSPVLAHNMCIANAQYEPIARAMGQGRGHTVYEQAQKCLEEKLPAAVAQAGQNADLKAAVKSWHAKAMTLMRSPNDRLVEKDEREAESVLEMEGKAAGVWH